MKIYITMFRLNPLEDSTTIFLQKHKFDLRKNLLVAIVLFEEGKPPKMYLIPSLEWSNPNGLLVSHDYDGKKSKPEWGLNISKKNLDLLNKFKFNKIIETM